MLGFCLMSDVDASHIQVLIVDDDEAFRHAMGKALRRRGFEVLAIADGQTAIEAFNRPPEVGLSRVAILDLRMPGLDGLEVLRLTPLRDLPVLVLTGHGSIPDAVIAMRLGAYSFLMKPLDAADLDPLLRQAVSGARPEEGQLIGEAPSTRALRALIERLATSDEPVLLQGEAGTGKEVAASFLHRCSRRRQSPFVSMNMACLPRDGVEAQLFGGPGLSSGAGMVGRGRLEEVGDGTLFLDEIAELPMEHQPKLLRAIETRSFRSLGDLSDRPFLGRLVVATQKDLAVEVRAGRFRQDLASRLQVLPLSLPPLRDRRDDVLPILRYWLRALSRRPLRLEADAETLLLKHAWPGNVRELVNLARRVALFQSDDVVSASLVRRMLAANPFCTDADAADSEGPAPPLEEITLEHLERRHIERLLAHHRNVTRVSEILGINRRTLQRKLRAWGIEIDGDGE